MSGVVIVEQRVGVPAGTLAVSAPSWVSGTTTIHAVDAQGNKIGSYYAQTEPYQASDGQRLNVAVFPTLPPGNYVVSKPGWTDHREKQVTVFPGSVAKVAYSD